MADGLQSWFRQLPMTLRREFAGEFRQIVDDAADDIRAAAPEGETGRTKQSVRVSRGRNSLELVIEAGGSLTTKALKRDVTYEREVATHTGDTQGIARGASGQVTYDYALADEFGTQHQPARPWFYSTWRARRAGYRQRIEALKDRIVDNL